MLTVEPCCVRRNKTDAVSMMADKSQLAIYANSSSHATDNKPARSDVTVDD